MADVQFVLVREGPSDDGLVSHIQTLLVRAGIDSVIGAARPYGGTTFDRLRLVQAERPTPDLVFVHRDADGRNPAARHAEVAGAARRVGWEEIVVPVVPVQELEAWLMTDHGAIRDVVGRPRGRVPLTLPDIRRIETTAEPKELLQMACLVASETSGSRYHKEAKKFDQRRRTLLERLDIDGRINELDSWKRFIDDLARAAQSVARR